MRRDIYRGWREIGWPLGVLIALAAVLVAIYFVSTAERSVADVNLEQLSAQPVEFAGRRVAVIGNVHTVVSPRSFVLTEAGDEILIVVLDREIEPSPEAQPVSVAPERLRVKGHIVAADDAQALRTAMGARYRDDVLGDYSGKLVLIAEVIQRLPTPRLEAGAGRI